MKAVYTHFIEVEVHLKNGDVFETNSDRGRGRYTYNYGEVPITEIIKFEVNGFLTEQNIELLHSYFWLTGNSGTTFFKKRRYIDFWTKNDNFIKFYEDEISYILIKTSYRIVDNPIIEWLERDLGFKGYSELIFDREQELKSLLLKG